MPRKRSRATTYRGFKSRVTSHSAILRRDLGWAKARRTSGNRSGAVALDPDGRIVDAGWTIGLEPTLQWVLKHASSDALSSSMPRLSSRTPWAACG